jgi:hypothetical protein
VVCAATHFSGKALILPKLLFGKNLNPFFSPAAEIGFA